MAGASSGAPPSLPSLSVERLQCLAYMSRRNVSENMVVRTPMMTAMLGLNDEVKAEFSVDPVGLGSGHEEPL